VILLESQSVDELLSRLASAKQYQLDNNSSGNDAMHPYASLTQTTTTVVVVVVVVSLSPQSMASLAMLHGLSPPDCARRLATVFKQLGAVAVFDTAWSRDVSLVETAAEFIHRYKQNNTPTTTTSTTITRASSSSLLPMLASACPGWVCYAEKTHGTVLPYISSTKSPQAVMGTVVKQIWAAKHGVAPSSIYHVAVMPCYDKKLEAARDDLTTTTTSNSNDTRIGGGVTITNEKDNNRVAETDCVLATSELQTLLEKIGITDLKAIQPTTTLDAPCTNDMYSNGDSSDSTINNNNNQPMYGVRGGSGGYLEYIYKRAARELFGIEIGTGPLAMTRGRNADFKEIILDIDSGSSGNSKNGGGGGKKKVLHFAAAYGFRNIQGLVRKIKTGKCPYDYVEVMACPSGCLNGGGQIKPEDIVRMMNTDDDDGDGDGDNNSGGNHRYKNAQEVLDVLDELYHAEGNTLVLRDPEDNPGVRGLYEEMGIQEVGGEGSRKVFHTEYHERSQSLASAVKDW